MRATQRRRHDSPLTPLTGSVRLEQIAMKRLLFGFLATVLVAISAPAGASISKSLSVPMRYQERDNWCWVASSQMIIRYYGKFFDEQCEVVENYRFRRPDWGTTNCCLSPDEGCNGWGAPGAELTSMGISIGHPASPLSFAQVKTQINADHPFAAWNAGHWMTALGYSEGVFQMILVNDPWPSEGQKWLLYSSYAAGWADTVTTSAPGSPYARLYVNNNLSGNYFTVTTGSSSFPTWPTNFNNVTSSARVVGSPYILYDDSAYLGAAWGVNAKDCFSYSEWYGVNDAVSSARPVPNTNWTATGVVLFENANFEGNYFFATDLEDLTPYGWAQRASSLIVVGGLAQVFQYANGGGYAYAVTSFGGPHYDGFYPNPASWGGLDNDISSVHVYSDDMTVNPSQSPIILYEHENMTGRGLLIKWVPARGGDDPIGWANYLGNQGMDDKITSIRTFAGYWTIYSDPYQQGTSAVLNPNKWYKNSGQFGLPNDSISSIAYNGGGWGF